MIDTDAMNQGSRDAPANDSTRTDRTTRVRRALDLAIAVTALILLAPVMAVVALAIKLESRGPVIYRGERIGLGGRRFQVWKFRSMHADADDGLHRDYVLDLLAGPSPEQGGEDEVAFKLHDDPRVTRVGRVIRATTLDELPQLVNVVRGEMSIVGPRPEVPYALEAYEPWHHARFDVLPGLTGLWQVSGRGDLSPREMLSLDVAYARDNSLVGDLVIMARTVPAVLRREGAQ